VLELEVDRRNLDQLARLGQPELYDLAVEVDARDLRLAGRSR
jgi:hypothetical protein